MSYQIKTTDGFDKEVKRLSKKYASLAHALIRLRELLSDNPEAGVLVGLGCRKIRLSIASKGRGKREVQE